ncbi:MAG: hypothetical protein RRA92_03940 [Gemmatimonadota bacterium]|nr:hypothetical protein [Gemmatimonadota bacterium]
MRKQRVSPALVAGAALALAGCGNSPITVQVLGEGVDGPVPQPNVEVRFLPFDRDSVFDLLDTQAETPRPEIPADMLETFEEIRAAQEAWREKDSEWSEGRDRLQRLSQELQGLDRRSRAYLQKYEEFGNLESQVARLEREKKELFDAFTAMQESVASRIDSFKIARDSWEEVAYEDYFDIEAEILAARKTEVFADTTNADGYVTRTLPGGDWWVSARVPTVRGELYWNVQVDPSAVDTLLLTPENGDDRLRL